MLDYRIFYSWQNDAPKGTNRTFIWDAINKAVQRLQAEDTSLNLQILERIDVDQGLQETPGSPEVASIMFEKIAESAIFIGDVTLVGQLKPFLKNEKSFPNPNVLIEEGFAASELGWSRVICIINEHFGHRDLLPFDMRNRRFPIAYTLAPDVKQEVKDSTKKQLIHDIHEALKTVRASDLRRADKALAQLDVHSFELANFYSAGSPFFQPSKIEPAQKIVALHNHDVYRQCVLRFLDLGLIRAHFAGGQYAYHWTFLGTNVLKLVVAAIKKGA